MSRKKIEISKDILARLYHEKRKTPSQIGAFFGCSFSTISNRLKEHGIQIKTPACARTQYRKKDFDGSNSLMAYMIGFRQGDLNVYIPRAKHSETIVARCNTIWWPILQGLFSNFGHVQVSNTSRVKSVNCQLNLSFNFLLPKGGVPDWIQIDQEASFAFIAGYVDAEANFIINQGRARFKLDTYDKAVLEWLHGFLCEQGIRSKFRLIAQKGDLQGRSGYKFNEDLWRINVNEAYSLKQFIYCLLPFMRHAGRIGQVKLMLSNIEDRRRYGSI